MASLHHCHKGCIRGALRQFDRAISSAQSTGFSAGVFAIEGCVTGTVDPGASKRLFRISGHDPHARQRATSYNSKNENNFDHGFLLLQKDARQVDTLRVRVHGHTWSGFV
jgi:hypothetical protein